MPSYSTPVFGQGTCDKPVENVCLSALIRSVLVYGMESGGDLLHIYPLISVYCRTKVFLRPAEEAHKCACLPYQGTR